MSERRTFRKRDRLHNDLDFGRIFSRRCSAGNATLVVYVDQNGLSHSRLGIRVGKRVGNAVCRSYVRRRIREAFRISRSKWPVGLDVICIAKASAADRHRDISELLVGLVATAVRVSRGGDKGR